MKGVQALQIVFSLIYCAANPAQLNAGADAVAGVWRGHSVCMVKNSPCHDEVNVYRVSIIREKPGVFFVSGNKVVDSKEEAMGTGEWTYNSGTHLLTYEFPRGLFRLKVEGEKMEGDLKLPDGTLYRQIFLEKDK